MATRIYHIGDGRSFRLVEDGRRVAAGEELTIRLLVKPGLPGGRAVCDGGETN